jgi:hypothetical protein
MTTFNQAQYDNLAVKSKDVYGQTKYDILGCYLADRPAMRILNVGSGSGDLNTPPIGRGIVFNRTATVFRLHPRARVLPLQSPLAQAVSGVRSGDATKGR